MCDAGFWRRWSCSWTRMVTSLTSTIAEWTGLRGGPCMGSSDKFCVNRISGGIDPFSVALIVVCGLVICNCVNMFWDFVKVCCSAIKPDELENGVQEYYQGVQLIQEQNRLEDMTQPLYHQMDRSQQEEQQIRDQMEAAQHRPYSNMVDSSCQVSQRNILRHTNSRMSVSRCSSRMSVCGSSSCMSVSHTTCGEDLRQTSCAWPRYDADPCSNYSYHRDVVVNKATCAWVRYPPNLSRQESRPRLIRCCPQPLPPDRPEVTYKDELTQTSYNDFEQALQKCRVVRHTRSGAVYSVYF